jgi:hypothetical protein
VAILGGRASAQTQTEKMSGEQLYKTVVALDSTLFSHFNTCNTMEMRKVFTEDLEFYHDKGGLTTSLQKFIEDFETGLCKKGNRWRSRRELIPGSVKVYPLNKFGAIMEGEHRFYETDVTTGIEYTRSSAKFTHVVQEVAGVWKIRRVLSYHHIDPPK